MERHRIRFESLGRTALVSLLAFGAVSCSLERKVSDEARVEIVFEGASRDSGTLAGRVRGWFGLEAQVRSESEWLSLPSSWQGFDCLGIQVSGNGVTPSESALFEPRVCSAGTVSLGARGALAGLVSTATGGALSVSVPIGTARTVELFGLKTSNGSCPNFESLSREWSQTTGGATVLGGADAVRGDMPVLLASTRVDLSADTSVTLTPSYRQASPTPVFCDGSEAGMSARLETTGVTIAGIDASEMALDPTLATELDLQDGLEIGVQALLRLDRRMAGTLDKYHFSALASSLPQGAELTVESVSRVDDFSYQVDAVLTLADADVDVTGATIRLSPSTLKDVYGRSLGSADLPIAQSAIDYLWSLGIDPDSIGEGGGSGDGVAPINPAPVPTGTVPGLRSRSALGLAFGCFITADQRGVQCAGKDERGELGRGSSVAPPSFDAPTLGLFPESTDIPEGEREIKRVSGYYHACSLFSGGSVKCWGSNHFGVLGEAIDYGASTQAPLPIPGLPQGVIDVVAGDFFTCALTSTSQVYCWGSNGYGQLGRGTVDPAVQGTMYYGTPAPVLLSASAALSGVTAIAAGPDHACAGTPGGAVCWGLNEFGQLGQSGLSEVLPWGGAVAISGSSTPVSVSGISSAVSSIALGTRHSCAIIASSGEVFCWGDNTSGQLARGEEVGSDSTAVGVEGIGAALGEGSSAVELAAGDSHTCVRLLNGAVRCWGLDVFGQLGNGGEGDWASREPVEVVDGVGAPIVASLISCGSNHACAVTVEGVRCWGRNAGAQTGLQSSAREPVVGFSVLLAGTTSVAGLSLAADSSIGFGAEAPPLVWGSNSGFGPLAARDSQVWGMASSDSVVGIELGAGQTIVQVVAGTMHACALTSVGRVFCWGSNEYGQLGLDQVGDRAVASEVVSLSGTVTQLAAGYDHVCALIDDGGRVDCWGGDGQGELGSGVLGSGFGDANPQSMLRDDGEELTGVTQLAAGAFTTCAVVGAEGSVWCTGMSADRGGATWSATPVLAEAGGEQLSGVAELALGYEYFCARMASGGAVKCWGTPPSGDISWDPQTIDGITHASSIAVGYQHACAVIGSGTDSTVRCWGENVYGQLGDGNFSSEATSESVRVAGGLVGPSRIIGGPYGTCADYGPGEYLCWGGNWSGQLGAGTGLQASPKWVDFELTEE